MTEYIVTVTFYDKLPTFFNVQDETKAKKISSYYGRVKREEYNVESVKIETIRHPKLPNRIGDFF